MRGEKSRRGRRSTTKKGRTAVWDIGRRRSLLHRWGRLSPATLCWLCRPQPQTRSRKVSYDLVREERGQVISNPEKANSCFCFLGRLKLFNTSCVRWKTAGSMKSGWVPLYFLLSHTKKPP